MSKNYTARQFFKALYGKDTPVTFRIFPESNRKSKQKAPSKYDKYNRIENKLKEANSPKNKRGVYFMVNPSGTSSTADKDVKKSYALFIDIDDNYLPPHFATPPDIVVSRTDGKGHHCYWLIQPVTDLVKWKEAQEVLIDYYKSDPTIKNPARLMRVPGTIRWKKDIELQPDNSKTQVHKNFIYEVVKLTNKRKTLSALVKVHSAKKNIGAIVDKKVSSLYKNQTFYDGDGRHQMIIKTIFLLNDYGLDEKEMLTKLTAINKKYFKDQYTLDELKQKIEAKKYAKEEAGNRAVDDALRDAAKKELIREKLENWKYNYATSEFIDLDDRLLEIRRNRDNFNAEFSKFTECSNAAAYVFRHDLVKTIERVIYEPTEPLLIEKDEKEYINTWKGPDIVPSKTNVKWFLDHVKYLFKTKKEAAHFLDFVAFALQNQKIKIRYAIVIIGRPGTGKSFLYHIMAAMYGQRNVKAPENEALTERYTAWAKDCQLCFIHEIFQTERRDFANKIKSYITEDIIQIREMYRDAYETRNYMNIIAVSNHESPLYMEKHDRRWFILKSEARPRPKTYYKKLFKRLDEPVDMSGLLYYFLNRDVSKFFPGERPPMTEAKKFILEQAVPEFDLWIKESIEEKTAPFDFDLVTAAEILTAPDLPVKFKHDRYITPNRVARILSEYGAYNIKREVKIRGKRLRLWAVRHPDKWEALEYTGGEFLTSVNKIYNKKDIPEPGADAGPFKVIK